MIRSINDYTSAIQINPDYTMAYTNRGNAYRALGKYQEAINDYTSAIKINPDHANAHNNRGNAYYDLGILPVFTGSVEYIIQNSGSMLQVGGAFLTITKGDLVALSLGVQYNFDK